MSTPIRAINIQSYRLMLYRRALHPELFQIEGRRLIEHAGYSFETWLMPTSHMMRFDLGNSTSVELITATESQLPERGLIDTLACAGEREHEHQFSDNVKYMCSAQTEQLPESLYKSTYDELIEHGQEQDALMYEWVGEDGGKNASILDTQRFRKEVHAQAYHLIANGGIVVRSQSIFEITKA